MILKNGKILSFFAVVASLHSQLMRILMGHTGTCVRNQTAPLSFFGLYIEFHVIVSWIHNFYSNQVSAKEAVRKEKKNECTLYKISVFKLPFIWKARLNMSVNKNTKSYENKHQSIYSYIESNKNEIAIPSLTFKYVYTKLMIWLRGTRIVFSTYNSAKCYLLSIL